MPKQNYNPNSRKPASGSTRNWDVESIVRIVVAIAFKLRKIIKALFSTILKFGAWLLKSANWLRAIPLLLRSMLVIMTIIGVFILVFLPDEKNKHLVYGSFFPMYIGMVASFLFSYFYTIQIRKRLILKKLRRAYQIGLKYSSLNPRRK